MISRYWEHCIVLLLALTVLMTPFASGISLAGMFLIFAFLLILRVFILSYIKQLQRYKRVKKARQKLLDMGDKVTPTNITSTEILYAAAKDKLNYELGSIIVSAMFMILGALVVDWNDWAANFLNWVNH